MLMSIRNQIVFLNEFRKRFETTGSIIPSSRFLARAITRFLAERPESPIRVLECGPGTGAFTDRIVRLLKPDDAFDLVELNPAFVEVLRRRFANESRWQAARKFSKIFQVPLQQFDSTQPYDFIISGLPLINFPPEAVRSIMDTYFHLLRPDGTLSYFEYMFIRPVRRVVTPGAAGKRVREVNAVLQPYLRQRRIARDTVFLNTPPAWVQHMKRAAT